MIWLSSLISVYISSYTTVQLRPFLGSRLTAGAESFDQPILIQNPFDEPLQIREVFTTEDFMSLKGMPPLLSTTTQLSTTMMTNEGEQDHSSSGDGSMVEWRLLSGRYE